MFVVSGYLDINDRRDSISWSLGVSDGHKYGNISSAGRKYGNKTVPTLNLSSSKTFQLIYSLAREDFQFSLRKVYEYSLFYEAIMFKHNNRWSFQYSLDKFGHTYIIERFILCHHCLNSSSCYNKIYQSAELD